MTWVEMLDSVYMGWFGRWSVTLFVLGLVMMFGGAVIDDTSDGEAGFIMGGIGALMFVLVLACGAVWLVARVLTWAVTGL